MHHTVKIFFVIFFSLLVKCSLAADSNPQKTLSQFNHTVRSVYATKIALVKQQLEPIIISQGNRLTLYYHHQKKDANIVPEAYTDLKIIAHVPLGIFSICYDPHDPALLKNMKILRAHLIAMQSVIDALPLTLRQKDRQKQIISQSLQFIDTTLRSGKFDQSLYRAYFKTIMPLITDNMDEAAISQLDALNNQMKIWKEEIAPADWKQLKVVLLGFHTPRQNNIITQYFEKLLQIPVDTTDRLVYGENISTDDEAFDLMARIIVDGVLAGQVFSDPTRMYRDVLGDSAAKYIKNLSVVH